MFGLRFFLLFFFLRSAGAFGLLFCPGVGRPFSDQSVHLLSAEDVCFLFLFRKKTQVLSFGFPPLTARSFGISSE